MNRLGILLVAACLALLPLTACKRRSEVNSPRQTTSAYHYAEALLGVRETLLQIDKDRSAIGQERIFPLYSSEEREQLRMAVRILLGMAKSLHRVVRQDACIFEKSGNDCDPRGELNQERFIEDYLRMCRDVR